MGERTSWSSAHAHSAVHDHAQQPVLIWRTNISGIGVTAGAVLDVVITEVMWVFTTLDSIWRRVVTHLSRGMQWRNLSGPPWRSFLRASGDERVSGALDR